MCRVPLDRPDGSCEHVLSTCRALSEHVDLTLLSPTGHLPTEPQSFPVVAIGGRAGSTPGTVGFNVAVRKRLTAASTGGAVVYVRAYPGLVAPATFWDLPYVAELNGIREAEMRLAGAPAWKRLAATAGESLLFKRAQHSVAVTPQIRDHIMARYGVDPRRVTVIPNAVDASQFPELEKEEARRTMGWTTDRPIVGFLGSLLPWQGVEDLMEAAALVEADVVIGGDGPERTSLEATAPPNVRFIGSVPRATVPAFLGACDVLVLTKRPLASGYSPIKLFTYMAAARPIVASAVPGLELVESSGAGKLVPPRDHVQLARAVTELMAASQPYGDRARHEVMARHTWDGRVHELLDVLRRVASGGG